MSGRDDSVLRAAMRAERWFVHQECIGAQLDYEAYQTADALRGAIWHIEKKEPQRVQAAEAQLKLIPYGDTDA